MLSMTVLLLSGLYAISSRDGILAIVLKEGIRRSPLKKGRDNGEIQEHGFQYGRVTIFGKNSSVSIN